MISHVDILFEVIDENPSGTRKMSHIREQSKKKKKKLLAVIR